MVKDAPTQLLLERLRAGDRLALDELFGRIHADLRRLAHGHRARWRGASTIDTTALVNETYVKLAGQQAVRAEDRSHFLAIAGRAMRHVLINYAEARGALKRGGGLQRVSLAKLDGHEASLDELITLCELLSQLEEKNERLARVVECRVLAGLDVEETAEALAVSAATVKRDWALASAWLYRELREDETNGDGSVGRR